MSQINASLRLNFQHFSTELEKLTVSPPYPQALHLQIQPTADKKYEKRASLVAQWLGIRLAMQGTWVRAPVREDPTCRGAARPVSHNC